jgi:hypothetical protein
MLKKTISYKDYNGVERTETFYFNLSETELTQMEFEKSGGLAQYIEKIVAAQEAPELMALFNDLIFKSYGEKSLDGKYFKKSKELSENFSQTEAYNELFMELTTNTDAGIAFMNGIMPAKLLERAKQLNAKRQE